MVTIKEPTQDQYWLPSGNPIVFSISTTTIYARLSYIIDVNINGTIVTQMKYPVYDRSNMNIDLRRVVNDYITDVFANDNGAFTTYPDEVASVSISVREEYFNGTSMVIDANPVKSNTVYVWRGVAQFPDVRAVYSFYRQFDLTSTIQYRAYGKFLGVKNHTPDVALLTTGTPLTGDQSLFYNLYPINPLIRRTMSYFTTSTATGNSVHTMSLIVWCYDSRHRLTKRFEKINGTVYVTSQYQHKIASIPVSAFELNNLTWDNITLDAGTLNYIDPSEDRYYFVTLTSKGGATPGSQLPAGFQWVGFELRPCSGKYKNYGILYKTMDGGWWQIHTNMKHFNDLDREASVKYNTWGIKAMESLPNSKRFKSVVHVEGNGSITLNTDWIGNQGVIDEIQQMILSHEIYLVGEGANSGTKHNSEYIPVILKDQEYRIYNKAQDKMIQYEFEFEEAYKKGTIV